MRLTVRTAQTGGQPLDIIPFNMRRMCGSCKNRQAQAHFIHRQRPLRPE